MASSDKTVAEAAKILQRTESDVKKACAEHLHKNDAVMLTAAEIEHLQVYFGEHARGAAVKIPPKPESKPASRNKRGSKVQVIASKVRGRAAQANTGTVPPTPVAPPATVTTPTQIGFSATATATDALEQRRKEQAEQEAAAAEAATVTTPAQIGGSEPATTAVRRCEQKKYDYNLSTLAKFSENKLRKLAENEGIEISNDLSKIQLLYKIVKILVEGGAKIYVEGCADLENQEGYIRFAHNSYSQKIGDVYVRKSIVSEYGLRTGDKIGGLINVVTKSEVQLTLGKLIEVHNCSPIDCKLRNEFDNCVAIYPTEAFKTELGITEKEVLQYSEILKKYLTLSELTTKAAKLYESTKPRSLKADKETLEHRKQYNAIHKKWLFAWDDYYGYKAEYLSRYSFLDDDYLENIATMPGRMIDLFSPIGKGQRGLLVAPPNCGKSMMLKYIAGAISQNHPESEIIMLLIDERPEEVTDMQGSNIGEVVASTFDESPEHHVKVAKIVFEMAKRRVELGKDVVILLESITRLSRACQAIAPNTGMGALSGGTNLLGLQESKRFLSAARKIENGGSLTIIASALVNTGSQMDEIIYKEFKATANMEIVLKQWIAEPGIYPSILLRGTRTRKDERLIEKKHLSIIRNIRRQMWYYDDAQCTERMIAVLGLELSNKTYLEKCRHRNTRFTIPIGKNDFRSVDYLHPFEGLDKANINTVRYHSEKSY